MTIKQEKGAARLAILRALRSDHYRYAGEVGAAADVTTACAVGHLKALEKLGYVDAYRETPSAPLAYRINRAGKKYEAQLAKAAEKRERETMPPNDPDGIYPKTEAAKVPAPPAEAPTRCEETVPFPPASFTVGDVEVLRYLVSTEELLGNYASVAEVRPIYDSRGTLRTSQDIGHTLRRLEAAKLVDGFREEGAREKLYHVTPAGRALLKEEAARKEKEDQASPKPAPRKECGEVPCDRPADTECGTCPGPKANEVPAPQGDGHSLTHRVLHWVKANQPINYIPHTLLTAEESNAELLDTIKLCRKRELITVSDPKDGSRYSLTEKGVRYFADLDHAEAKPKTGPALLTPLARRMLRFIGTRTTGETVAQHFANERGQITDTLMWLTDNGYVQRIEHDGFARAELTDAGRAYLATLPEEVAGEPSHALDPLTHAILFNIAHRTGALHITRQATREERRAAQKTLEAAGFIRTRGSYSFLYEATDAGRAYLAAHSEETPAPKDAKELTPLALEILHFIYNRTFFAFETVALRFGDRDGWGNALSSIELAGYVSHEGGICHVTDAGKAYLAAHPAAEEFALAGQALEDAARGFVHGTTTLRSLRCVALRFARASGYAPPQGS